MSRILTPPTPRQRRALRLLAVALGLLLPLLTAREAGGSTPPPPPLEAPRV